MKKLKIGMLLFPQITIMDFVGPYEVFIRANCFDVVIVSHTTASMHAEGGLTLKADVSFDDCPLLDILFVPGGRGVNPLLTDQHYIRFLQHCGQTAHYVTSVCTGALVLAAAGLLDGFKATTHWRSLDLLRMMGIETLSERVVIDRNRITGGGITAGLDFGLVLVSHIGGEDMAKTIQLLLEYSPLPPFESGSPQSAEAHILKNAKDLTQATFDERLTIIQKMKLLS